MRNILKNPLKVIVAGMFVVAMGFGMSTSLNVSDNIQLNDVNLSLLQTAAAQGENGGAQGCNACTLTGGWTCLNILCNPGWRNPGYDCDSWVWC